MPTPTPKSLSQPFDSNACTSQIDSMAGTSHNGLLALNEIYKMYDDGKLQDFMNAAAPLLKEDSDLDRFHTINLLILTANAVAGSNAAGEAYLRALALCPRAHHSDHAKEEVPILNELEVKLTRVRVAFEAERKGLSFEQRKEMDRTIARGTARETTRDKSIKAGLNSIVTLRGRDHGIGSSPETGSPSRKRRKVEDGVVQGTSEEHDKASTGQEGTLKDKLLALLQSEREIHAMLVKRHQTEIENHQTEIGRHKREIEKQGAEIKTQLARMREIDKELERL